MLTADPINAVFEDREFKAFKTKQFERAFPGKQPLDATGRGMDTPPVVRDVEPFEPTLRRDDLSISGAVGEEARNRPAEVIKLKKALANTGLFDFDVTKEKSTDAGPLFRDATKAFQRLNGIEPDGCIKPDCPTRKALGDLFFPEGSTNSKASPVDLRPAAARAGVAANGAGGSLIRNARAGAADSGSQNKSEAPGSELAEMRIERPVPPNKRSEFAIRFRRVAGASATVLKKLKDFPNIKNVTDRVNAEGDILNFLGSLAEDFEGVAKIIDAGELQRAADALKNEVTKGEKGLSRGQSANIVQLSLRLNQALGLYIALLGSRDA